jgi:hypothetical protein
LVPIASDRHDDSAVQRFDNRAAQAAVAAFGSLIALLGLSGLADSSSRLTAAVYLAFGAYTIFRGLRSSSVIVGGSSVTTRSMVRTRRYPFAELRGVEVVLGRTGLVGSKREYLVFQQVDGQSAGFKDFNTRAPRPPSTKSIVREAAMCINARLPQ